MRGKRLTIPMGYALRRPRLRGWGGKFAVECMATLPWNTRRVCDGIGGNFAMGSVATLAWNAWQLWRGIGGNFHAEYADWPRMTRKGWRRLASGGDVCALHRRPNKWGSAPLP